MEVRITNEPYMLLETVELLYAFVNEMPVEDLTGAWYLYHPPGGAAVHPPDCYRRVVQTRSGAAIFLPPGANPK